MPVGKYSRGRRRAKYELCHEQYWIKKRPRGCHYGKTADHGIEACREVPPDIQAKFYTKPTTQIDVTAFLLATPTTVTTQQLRTFTWA